MATWTTPRTWVTDEVVTAAQMNEQVRDNTTYSKEMGENASIGVVFDGGGADVSSDSYYILTAPGDGEILGSYMRAGEADDLVSSDGDGNTIVLSVQRLRDSDGDAVFSSDYEIIADIMVLDSDTGIHDRLGADSDWTVDIYENDQIKFLVESCTGVVLCTAQLYLEKS